MIVSSASSTRPNLRQCELRKSKRKRPPSATLLVFRCSTSMRAVTWCRTGRPTQQGSRSCSSYARDAATSRVVIAHGIGMADVEKCMERGIALKMAAALSRERPYASFAFVSSLCVAITRRVCPVAASKIGCSESRLIKRLPSLRRFVIRTSHGF